ncbi:MAG: dienelactone hydrolase family protein [Burkholderiales bacterium]|nr:dienelactone hydrolase family protein [Burkholderiales bacterium]
MAGRTIELRDAQGNAFNAYVSQPAGGRSPGVVFGVDIFGLRPLYHDIADQFASKGFLAVAPDYFWDVARGEDGSYRATHKFPTCIEVVRSSIAAVRAMPECNGRVAVNGYCVGGNLALIGVSRLGADAGVSYYGTRIHTFLEDLQLIARPLILHIAEHDHTYPDEQRDRILAAAQKNANVAAYVYAAPHGFASSSFQAEAAQLANQRTFELLDTLK